MKSYQPHHTVVLRGLDGRMEHITVSTFRMNQYGGQYDIFYGRRFAQDTVSCACKN